jgi:hypothetical protein
MEAIEDAYAGKYTTPASRSYVRGFKTARRRRATMELLPRFVARASRPSWLAMGARIDR